MTPGSEDFSLGNSVVTPISEKTAQVCWQYPNYFPRMLKEVRINSFDMQSSRLWKQRTKKSYLVGNKMVIVVDRYAQGSRKWKCFNRRWDKAKEGERNLLQLSAFNWYRRV